VDLRIAISGVYDISDIELLDSLLRELVKNRQLITEAVNNSLPLEIGCEYVCFYPLRQGWSTGGLRGKHMRPFLSEWFQ
jgi:hypothetical protein